MSSLPPPVPQRAGAAILALEEKNEEEEECDEGEDEGGTELEEEPEEPELAQLELLQITPPRRPHAPSVPTLVSVPPVPMRSPRSASPPPPPDRPVSPRAAPPPEPLRSPRPLPASDERWREDKRAEDKQADEARKKRQEELDMLEHDLARRLDEYEQRKREDRAHMERTANETVKAALEQARAAARLKEREFVQRAKEDGEALGKMRLQVAQLTEQLAAAQERSRVLQLQLDAINAAAGAAEEGEWYEEEEGEEQEL